MQDLEQLKEHQEYKLTKLMINGVVRMVASNCINSGYEVYLEENNITTMLKVFTDDSKEDYIRLMVFHFPSTNTVDLMYAQYINGKKQQVKDTETIDVNNLYNLLMQAINEVIPCQQQQRGVVMTVKDRLNRDINLNDIVVHLQVDWNSRNVRCELGKVVDLNEDLEKCKLEKGNCTSWVKARNVLISDKGTY